MKLIGYVLALACIFIGASYLQSGNWFTAVIFLISCWLAFMAGSGLRSSIHLKSPLLPSIIFAAILLAISNGLIIWRKAYVQLLGIEIGGALWMLLVAFVGFAITTRRASYTANPDMVPKD